MFIEIGRLTRDVVVKKVMVLNDEKLVLNNCIAVNHYKDTTSFIDLSAWSVTADVMCKYLKKGDEVFIEVELRSRKVKAGDKEITVPFILVNKVKFTHGNKGL